MSALDVNFRLLDRCIAKLLGALPQPGTGINCSRVAEVSIRVALLFRLFAGTVI